MSFDFEDTQISVDGFMNILLFNTLLFGHLSGIS